jgi:hypothetical protein
VRIPVIASGGGGGTPQEAVDAICQRRPKRRHAPTPRLIASMVHYGDYRYDIIRAMHHAGVLVRRDAHLSGVFLWMRRALNPSAAILAHPRWHDERREASKPTADPVPIERH